ncbi:hypothetical protein PHMEG_00020966 [Phytophthora megakarya]|uniref:Uncharacterized protein n=1 Tax=Phytophthora megakarya TaxID=4795 RepID=A0A225VN28_9STRA|nr:hypothetical protein PHMEG_00020966 [Phytophthora megakarya]
MGSVIETIVIRSEFTSRETIDRPLRHPFNFNGLSSDECMTTYRFSNEQLVQLIQLVGLTGITTKEGTRATGIEGLCIVLYRLAVPMRPSPRNATRDRNFLSQQSVYSGHKRKHALKYQIIFEGMEIMLTIETMPWHVLLHQVETPTQVDIIMKFYALRSDTLNMDKPFKDYKPTVGDPI